MKIFGKSLSADPIRVVTTAAILLGSLSNSGFPSGVCLGQPPTAPPVSGAQQSVNGPSVSPEALPMDNLAGLPSIPSQPQQSAMNTSPRTGGPESRVGAAGDMIGFSHSDGSGSQTITLVNTSKSWMAVYHIDRSGKIRLASSRPIDADFTLQLNATAPLPDEIRRMDRR